MEKEICTFCLSKGYFKRHCISCLFPLIIKSEYVVSMQKNVIESKIEINQFDKNTKTSRLIFCSIAQSYYGGLM